MRVRSARRRAGFFVSRFYYGAIWLSIQSTVALTASWKESVAALPAAPLRA
jgi:hypothetical protein